MLSLLKHPVINSSFVSFMYTEHISFLDRIIILGTELRLESVIELIRICDMHTFCRTGQTSGIGVLSLHHTDHLCHLVPSLSDLLELFVVDI